MGEAADRALGVAWWTAGCFPSHIGFESKSGPIIGRKISSYTAYSKPSRCGLEELPVHQNIEHERSFSFAQRPSDCLVLAVFPRRVVQTVNLVLHSSQTGH